jgi:hypothetical protein
VNSLTAWIENRNSDFTQFVDFLVVPQIAGLLPIKPFEVERWEFTRNVTFVDEGFNKSTMKFSELVPRLLQAKACLPLKSLS